jgi:predicted component of type VI protein secretion system
MNEEIKKLIKQFEDRLKSVETDQRTDDAMHPKKFEGFSQAYEEVITELKKLV